MAYQDSVNGTAVTEAFLDETSKQVVLKYATAAARAADAPLVAALREGMVYYQDDINSLIIQRDTTSGNISTIGPVHGALTTWAPTWTQSATVTNTVTNGSSTRTGRWIQAECLLTATGGGTAANTILLTTPVAALGGAGLVVGQGVFFDASANAAAGAVMPFTAVLASTTTIRLQATTATGATVANALLGSGSLSGFTLAIAAGDTLSMAIQFEAAADA